MSGPKSRLKVSKGSSKHKLKSKKLPNYQASHGGSRLYEQAKESAARLAEQRKRMELREAAPREEVTQAGADSRVPATQSQRSSRGVAGDLSQRTLVAQQNKAQRLERARAEAMAKELYEAEALQSRRHRRPLHQARVTESATATVIATGRNLLL